MAAELVPPVGGRLGPFGPLALGISGLCTVIWLLTGAPTFWPAWVWLGLATACAVGLVLVDAPAAPGLLTHQRLAIVAVVHCTLVWFLAGSASFWPAWVVLGVGTTVLVHVELRRRSPQEARLAARVDTLERTRRGALDVQAAELRRIERDLHDGAQARLVALTMRLGRAEARLEHDPEAAQLVRDAREDATAAIAELRDLARGIAPPILADRGLEAAAQALVDRAPVPAGLVAELPRRLPPVVEGAAYFVVGEALTNVAKHAPGATATVVLREHAGELHVTVTDDGPGGAIATGSGIAGLRQRADALDGTLLLVSPAGQGTTLEVVLPCGS